MVFLKTMNFLKKIGFSRAGLALMGFFLFVAGTAAQSEAPRKVALLPLQINAQDKLDYLRDGLLDIMASRLAWEGKVVVLDQDPVRQALVRFPGTVNELRAQEIGKSLGVDLVVYGSLTMVGAGASLDLRVKDLAKNQTAEKFFAETKKSG